ncbi:MAG: hypothetical protein OXI96_03820 [Acidimicrobiaceae bacterium]|nr:hypothetical protein [Acidimicrobiaceae bacterium]
MELETLMSIIVTEVTVLGVVVAAGFGLYKAVASAQRSEFDKINDRFTALDDKVTALDDKVGKVIGELGKLNVAVTRIDTQQREHEKKLEATGVHGERIAKLEAARERPA